MNTNEHETNSAENLYEKNFREIFSPKTARIACLPNTFINSFKFYHETFTVKIEALTETKCKVKQHKLTFNKFDWKDLNN